MTDAKRALPRGEDVVATVRAETGPRTILSFSCGKDSIAAWLAIRDSFDDVIPYYLYPVPGLEFIEEALTYFEGVLGRRIIRLPHPSLYRMLNALTYQPPDRVRLIQAAKLPNFDYTHIREIVIKAEGLPKNALVASGVRAADSPMRRISMMTHGAISRNQGQYYPCVDWNKARVVEAISKAGIKLPVDYSLFGRSFDGIDTRFLAPLKKHRPADYQRILDWFPLADMELWMLERDGLVPA